MEGDKPKRQWFKRYPIGFFHIDIAEVQTSEGKLLLFMGIDRTSKFAVVHLVATLPPDALRHDLRGEWDRVPTDQSEPSVDERPGRSG